MNIAIWEDKIFNDIPRADNPAFTENDEGIMIVKCNQFIDGYRVLWIGDQFDEEGNKISERVLSLGIFWEVKDAKYFAEAYLERVKVI